MKATELQYGDSFYVPAMDEYIRVERVSEPYRAYGRTIVTVHGVTSPDGMIASVDMTPETNVSRLARMRY